MGLMQRVQFAVFCDECGCNYTGWQCDQLAAMQTTIVIDGIHHCFYYCSLCVNIPVENKKSVKQEIKLAQQKKIKEKAIKKPWWRKLLFWT